MTVTVTGWIYVYKLGQKNVTRDKRITTYITAFNFMKDPIYNAIRRNSEFCTYLFITYSYLERLSKESILYNSDVTHLINSFNNKEFEKLNKLASSSYLDFSYTWEQYEIVFMPLVKQRWALQEEYRELISIVSEGYVQYTAFLYSLNLNQGEVFNENQKLTLVNTIKDMHDRLLDFFSCLSDVNVNLQNFVFGDLLDQTIDKRIVLDERYLTIYTLMKKHKVDDSNQGE